MKIETEAWSKKKSSNSTWRKKNIYVINSDGIMWGVKEEEEEEKVINNKH